jgi:hypothetical protein
LVSTYVVKQWEGGSQMAHEQKFDNECRQFIREIVADSLWVQGFGYSENSYGAENPNHPINYSSKNISYLYVAHVIFWFLIGTDYLANGIMHHESQGKFTGYISN